MKHLKLAALALFALPVLVGCSDEDPAPAPVVEPPYEGAFVINQGSYYNGIDGTIGTVDLSSLSYADDVFAAVNGQSLGDSPQGAVKYGSKLYVPMYGSNLLWVLDAASLRIVAQVTTTAPEGVTAAEGCVFVTNNDGYVSRIDTLDYTVKSRVAVGPNPAHITAHGGYVYASISDGFNYGNENSANDYANGKRVAVIDAATGEKLRDINVGLNPGPIVADNAGNVFVVARGNYADVAAKVQKIAAGSEEVTDFAVGQLIATDGSTLYVLNSTANYVTGSVTTISKSFDTATGNVIDNDLLDAAHEPGMPVSIDVDTRAKRLYICSDNSATGYLDRGSLHVYTTEGNYVGTTATGIHPCGVVFY